MNKSIYISFLFFLLGLTSVFSQNIVNYNDAVTFFTNNPPISEYEGIYEIWETCKNEDVKVISGIAMEKNHGFGEYQNTGEVICVYHFGNELRTSIIKQDGGRKTEDYGFRIAETGGLRYKVQCHSSERNKYFQYTFNPDNFELEGVVVVINSDLIFELAMPSQIALWQTQGDCYSLKVTYKMHFKKIYKPQMPAKNFSGTGFAISADGYIVTNYHLVSDAKKISVKGIGGDFRKQYSAEVVSVDKNNDLAILKIYDSAFVTTGKIPYVIAKNTIDVGSSVYVLGYPLRALMGDEIKLTTGIISAKSGFQGDVSCYQISAPLQPGNSGGPMFDFKGNIAGIATSKLIVADNASYSIKTTFLFNLIESLPVMPKLNSVNLLANKPLTEQVKLVKNFIYIIDVQN